MKRGIVMFLAGVCISGMVSGCVDSDQVPDVTTEVPIEVTTEEPIEVSIAETLSLAQEEAAGDGIVHFYVVRHGKTMLNTTDRVQGWSDAVLTPAGEETVTYAARGVKAAGIKFTAAYSSDSGRSIQTGQIILDEIGQSDLHLNTDWRLREFNFGTYEGDLNHTMWTDIAADQGLTLEEWLAKGVDPREFANSVAKLDQEKVESGINWPAEDYDTITARLDEVLTEIAAKVSEQGGGNVLVVSHGLSIRAMIEMIQQGEMPDGVANASITTIDYEDGAFSVKKMDDTSYIEAGKD